MKKKSVPIRKLMNLAATGKLNVAFKLLKKTSKGKTDPEIWVKLSGIYGEQGSLKLTKECCEKALEINPQYALAYSHLGNVYVAAGDSNKAAKMSQQAVKLQPDSPAILYNFAIICRNLGNYPLAVHHLEKAIELRPGHLQSHFIAGECYQFSGNLEKLIEHYMKVLELKSDHIGCLVALGYHYNNVGDLKLSADYFDKALASNPGNNSALSGKAGVCLRSGDKASAYTMIRELIDSGNVIANTLNIYSLLGEDYGDTDELIRLSKSLLSNLNLPNSDKSVLGFSLGRIYDRLGDYNNAFANYKLANDSSKNVFDTNDFGVFIQRIIDRYDRDFVKQFAQSSENFEEPIFIIGMPRSGTSLIEQILSSHSNVHSAGELNYIPEMVKYGMEMVASNGVFPSGVEHLTVDQLNDLARVHIERLHELANNDSVIRITDKMPSNYTYLGLIAQAFPKAKIIHCQRDPRDTCLSIYFQNFQNFQKYAGDIEKIGKVYLQYRRTMDHWDKVLDIPILNIQYESVVADAEKKAREIIEFCGLDWEDECMDFHKSKRRVITASFDQVNKPIYTKSVARWKKYEKHLEKLQKILKPVLPDAD